MHEVFSRCLAVCESVFVKVNFRIFFHAKFTEYQKTYFLKQIPIFKLYWPEYVKMGGGKKHM